MFWQLSLDSPKHQSFGGERGNRRTPTLALCQPKLKETTTKPKSTALQHNTGILLFSWKHKVHQDHFLLLLLTLVRVPRPENNIIVPAATFVQFYYKSLCLYNMNCHVYISKHSLEGKLSLYKELLKLFRPGTSQPGQMPGNKFLPSVHWDFGGYLWELVLIGAVEVILFDITLAEHRQGLSQGLGGHHTLQFGLLQVLLLLTDNIGHLLLQRGVVRMLLGKNKQKMLKTKA